MMYFYLFVALTMLLGVCGEEVIYPTDSFLDAADIYPFSGSLSSARVHHTVSLVGHYVVVYGGYSTDGSFMGDINLYDTNVRQWSGPLTRIGCCNSVGLPVETLGGGGQSSDSSNSSITGVNVYPPILSTFSRTGYQGDNLPLPRAEHATVGISTLSADDSETLHKLFMFGGITTDFGYMNDLYSFDIATLQWRRVDVHVGSSGSIPTRRAGHSLVTDSASPEESSAFYLFGGRGGNIVANTLRYYNDVWKFDTLTSTWSLLTSQNHKSYRSVNRGQRNPPSISPVGREASACIVQMRRLWVFGGKSTLLSAAGEPSSMNVYNDVWSFHLYSNTWVEHKANSGSATGYGPPPLFNAYLVPIERTLPVDASVAVSEESGFVVYGGVGAGGACAPVLFVSAGPVTSSTPNSSTSNTATEPADLSVSGNVTTLSHSSSLICDPLETSLGQAYKFTVVQSMQRNGVSSLARQGTRDNFVGAQPVDVNGTSTLLGGEIVSTTWEYARISSSSGDTATSTTPSLHRKIYGYEKLAYDAARGYLYEVGGLQKVAFTGNELTNALMTLLDAGSTYIPRSGTGTDVNSQTISGSEDPIPVRWDTNSGESLKEEVVNTPVNGPSWGMRDAFRQTQPNLQNTSHIRFLHALRTFHIVSSRSAVLKDGGPYPIKDGGFYPEQISVVRVALDGDDTH